MSEAVTEYRCEGCGVDVLALGVSEPPAHGFCCVCSFLSQYITDPDTFSTALHTLITERNHLDTPDS